MRVLRLRRTPSALLPLMPWFVYVLRNERGRFYVGSTGRSPEIRLAEHNAGLNRWTRPRGPWCLVYWEARTDKLDALARERFLKTSAGRRVRDSLVTAAEVVEGL